MTENYSLTLKPRRHWRREQLQELEWSETRFQWVEGRPNRHEVREGKRG